MPSDVSSPREEAEQAERQRLPREATLSSDERCSRRVHPLDKCEYRTEFQRDYTRIIHCRAFRRSRHKTQVFISPRNDHLCTRLEHQLHVASVAATIAQALHLNVDLVRAIAVGHDLGHAPFGHKGEKTLDEIAKGCGLSFYHELHSLRVVDYLESPYPEHHGLNLTFAVRDGIACHYGEGFERELSPDRGKPFDALARMERGARPATLEGCVVRWSDKIAYLGRDLEDALTLGLVSRTEVPQEVQRVLGVSNREVISALVGELVRNGIDDDRLAVSDQVHTALNAFYDFNMESIYKAPQAQHAFNQIDRAMRILFELLLDRLQKAQGDLDAIGSNGERSLGVFRDFLEDDIRNWEKEKPEQLVIDFIAGMTDSFFCQSFSELFLPQSMV